MTSTHSASRLPKWWISMRWLVPIAAASSRRLRSEIPRAAMWSIAASSSFPRGSLPAIAQKCTMWYIMTPPQPVTVSIDVPQDRASVYAYLDVMANHEPFTDHMLTNWRVSGPPTGVGSKANVTAKVGAITDESEIEVFEVEDGRMIRERTIAAKGKRIAHGTYTLQRPAGRRHAHRVRVRAAEGAGDREAAAAADAQDGPQGQRERDGAPRRDP